MALFKNNTLLTFISIIFLSAIFRVTNLDLIEFKIDEASNLLLAARPLFDHPFPYGGILTSVGTLNFPLFNYLLFPFVLISLDPKLIVFVIAVVNSLAIGVLFLTIKKYYNATLALIASLILAFSPWSILFSRKIWPPDLMFFFSVLLLLCIHKIIIDKKTEYWILFATSSLFLIQLDLSSVFFILLISLFILIQKPKVSLRYIFIGLLLGILPAIPYIVYELKNGCPDCMLLFIVKKELIKNNYDIFLKPLQIINQGNFWFILGNDTVTFLNRFPIIFKLKALFYIEYLLIPIGIYLYWKKYKTLRFFTYVIIMLPFLYFAFHLEPLMHYFVITIPYLAIFLAISFYYLILSKNSVIKYGSVIALAIIIVYSIFFNLAFFGIVREQGGLNGDYGAALNKILPYLQEQFVKYKNFKGYQEIILSSHIPYYLMRGTSPFARMLYPYEETKKNLKILEKDIEFYPDDPRLIQRLVVYYTTKKPSQETFEYLKNKALPNSPYEKIYHEVYNVFLRKKY